MEKRLTMIFATLFLCIGMAMAQSKVSGVVTSAEGGEPVVGASVKVVGTNTGTVTNIDGQFQLQIADGAKLEISYIGMQTKTVKATPKMKIVLDPDNQSLDEVMVVAFGTAKKSAFTGSAAVVDAKELSKKVTTNVAESLVGSVAGLQLRGQSGQPGTSAVQGDDPSSGIKIRGIASMYASTNPLVIVDGAPYPGNLSSIPSDDIESVTVLKDAASAALYGARGANGIVMAEPLAGLLSPDLSAEFSCRYVAQIVDALQDDNFLIVYHNCGNNTVKMIDEILSTGVLVMHFGNSIDMAEMMPHIPGDRIAMGNVSPAEHFRNGTPASTRQATLELMEKCAGYPNFVPSSGCDIPPVSPWENIDAFFAAVKEYYTL